MDAATRCPRRRCWKRVRRTRGRLRPPSRCRLHVGIAGSDLGRPALAILSSLTTWISGVEETIATAKSCGDIKAQAMASERPTTTRAATSDSSTINAVERATRQKEGMIGSLVLQHEIAMLLHEASSALKQSTRSSKNCIYTALS